MNRTKQNKGFSLIELIIAIAILVILTGFLAPNLLRYLEKSRESVCRKNMDEMLNIYRMEHVGNDKYEVDNVITTYKDREPCPSDGEYSDVSGIVKYDCIMCSVHDKDALAQDPITMASNQYYKEMLNFTSENKDLDMKKLQALLQDKIGMHYVTNNTLRTYLLQEVYNGIWPTFDNDFLERNKISTSKPMNIQPYIDIQGSSADKATKNNVLLYANTSSENSNWNATLIYNYEEGVWYKSPDKNSIGFADKSWSEVKVLMENNKWKPIK